MLIQSKCSINCRSNNLQFECVGVLWMTEPDKRIRCGLYIVFGPVTDTLRYSQLKMRMKRKRCGKKGQAATNTEACVKILNSETISHRLHFVAECFKTRSIMPPSKNKLQFLLPKISKYMYNAEDTARQILEKKIIAKLIKGNKSIFRSQLKISVLSYFPCFSKWNKHLN